MLAPFGPRHQTYEGANQWLFNGLGNGILRAWGYDTDNESLDKYLVALVVDITESDRDHALSSGMIKLTSLAGRWRWWKEDRYNPWFME